MLYEGEALEENAKLAFYNYLFYLWEAQNKYNLNYKYN